tara:strand:+ start:205 stop:345 length:141 start_codon:yes stop_codon:yes gene_type:complete
MTPLTASQRNRLMLQLFDLERQVESIKAKLAADEETHRLLDIKDEH